MVVFGVVLLALGVILVVGGIFGTSTSTDINETDTVEVTTKFFGFSADLTTIFVIGALAAVLILTGLWLMKYGAKRGWSKRKERKKLDEMHDKMVKADREEAQRGNDND